MVQFQALSDQVKEWFPETYKCFIDELRSSRSRYNDTPEEKIYWSVSWGSFVKKANTQEEYDAQREAFMNKMSLTYDERIEVEIPIIRCSISMKAGQYYRTDRSLESEMPEYILNMVKEILKVTMMQEQMHVGDPRVLESLEEFRNMLYSNDSDFQGQPENLDMDSILDKINEKGIKSLTSNELRYLQEMSKS